MRWAYSRRGAIHSRRTLRVTPNKLPGLDETPPDQIVLHVDMDCFYASCERLREPALNDEPVVVGMGYEEESDVGAVATASYEARDHGVESAMAISEALERLPRTADDRATGEYRPVDMEFYEQVSDEIMAILDEHADVLRVVSIDEAYLDVTSQTDWSRAESFARDLKTAIKQEVGVPASIGAAPTMGVAKIASDYDKPDGLTTVPPESIEEFLYPLDVEKIHGIGPVTADELRNRGIETVGDLAHTEPSVLTDLFGERGEELYRRARGLDDRDVTPMDDPKSFSREAAFNDPVTEMQPKRETVRELAADVASRASDEGATYQTIGIKIVTPPFEINTRERSLSGPIDDSELVEDVALDLLTEFGDERVRKLGVRVSNLSFADGTQTRLDGWEGDVSPTTQRAPSIPSSDDDESEQSTLTDFDQKG